MGRGPEEDDGEQHDRGPGQAAGDRGPPDEHRGRPGGPADDDVLGGGPLEPERVDEDVEEAGRHGEHGGEQVDRPPEQGEGDHLQPDGEGQRRPRGDHPGDQGTVLGPLHEPVDVAVDDHVDGVGPAGGQGAAQHGPEHEPARGEAPGRHHLGGHGGDEQQLDDAGLGEGEVGGRRWSGWPAPLGTGQRGRTSVALGSARRRRGDHGLGTAGPSRTQGAAVAAPEVGRVTAARLRPCPGGGQWEPPAAGAVGPPWPRHRARS